MLSLNKRVIYLIESKKEKDLVHLEGVEVRRGNGSSDRSTTNRQVNSASTRPLMFPSVVRPCLSFRGNRVR